MTDPQIIRAQREILRLEDEIVQQVIEAYERARQEMVEILLERFEEMGPNPTPDQVRALARDAGVLREIEAQLAELGREYGQIIEDGLTEVQRIGLDQAQAEIEALAARLGIDVTPFTGFDRQLPALIEALMRQVEGISDQYRTQMTGELLTSLLRGDDFRTIVRRLLAADPGPDGISLARQRKNSAELLARRVVIEANNASRQRFYEQAAESIDGLKKQLVAAVQAGRTTETCLRAHGQIREIKEPFELTGKPRFADRLMYPPFHWRCRSATVAYHPSFEEGSRVTTESMRQAAQEELDRRAG